MRNLKNISIIAILIVSFLSGCKKESLITTKQLNHSKVEAILDLGTKVNANFFGRIVDENNNAISNVAITVGNKTTKTDSKGIFAINKANVFEKMAYLKATKSGYFLGSRSLTPSTTATNNINIVMLEMNVIETVNSNEEKTVELSNGAKIDFKGKYISTNGNSYSGIVNVSFKHIEETNNKMPGMLFAQNKNEEAGAIETFGIFAVELTSENGEELQIDPDSYATVHFPIKDSQLSAAPELLSLMHFDEIAGYWVEEEEATLINGEYVGNVNHFSFWNTSRFSSQAQIKAIVTDQDGNPLANATVEVSTTFNSTIGTTNSDGTFYTFVPSDISVSLQVNDDCGNAISNSIVGPYSVNSINNEILSTTITSINSLQVVGLLYDCSSTLITNGYVELNSGTKTYYQPITNGSINIPVLFCTIPTNFTITGFDYDNSQRTNETSVPATATTTNVGNLIACNSITEYISYTIDSGSAIVKFPSFTCSEDTNGLQPTFTGYGSDFKLSLSSTVIGSYNWGSTGIMISNTDINVDYSQPVNIICQLTNYGPIGSYVDVNFSGDYTDPSGVLRFISGTVHVIRDL